MADQPWIKVPLSFLDKFGYTDKLFAAMELMRTADTITRRIDVSLHAIALRWGHDRRWARVFVRDLKTLCAACLLPPQHPPHHPPEVDFSGFYGGRSTPSSTLLAPPLGPESDLHNKEHAPARGSILKELKNKKQIPPTPQGAVIEIPIWIDSVTWSEWVQFRKEKKQPLKPTTVRRQIQKLTTLRDSGQDPNAIIVQSITNGWTGLFPVNQNGSGGYDYIGVSERVARLARAAESQATTTSGDEGPDGPSEHVQVRPEE